MSTETADDDYETLSGFGIRTYSLDEGALHLWCHANDIPGEHTEWGYVRDIKLHRPSARQTGEANVMKQTGEREEPTEQVILDRFWNILRGQGIFPTRSDVCEVTKKRTINEGVDVTKEDEHYVDVTISFRVDKRKGN